MVTEAALTTAADERAALDDSAWIVRAVCEKLQREWERVGTGRPVPDLVRVRARHGMARRTDPVRPSGGDAAAPAAR